MTVQVEILGPLTVRVDAAEVAIGGARRTRLLAALVLRRNRWCSASQLAQLVWGDESGQRSPATLQSHVAHLRRVLEPDRDPGTPAGVLTSGEAGYRLVLGPTDVDAEVFAVLVARAARELATAPAVALRSVDEALAIWRGHPLEDVDDPLAPGEIARLESLRFAADETRLEALIRVGRDADAVTEAEQCVDAAPLRERRWELLMLALYRTSRQAEALRTHERARTLLDHLVGLRPGPGLREMERRVLDHDPALLAEDPFATAPAPMPLPAAISAAASDVTVPQIRYARSGTATIAYQWWGSGPWFVATPPLAQNIEVSWESPYWRRMFDRVGARSRFVHFDKRGTGMSDRTVDMSFEQRIDDFRSVMDAAGIESAVLCGVSEGGPLAAAFAATHPERCSGLVLCGTFARVLRSPDYPIGLDEATYLASTGAWERWWGTPQNIAIDHFSPSLAEDQAFRTWSARYMRQSCSPGTLALITAANAEVDIRPLLSELRVPTLVIHRTGDRVAPVEWGRYLADHIPGARYVELPGDDHLPWVGANWAELVDLALDFVEEHGA